MARFTVGAGIDTYISALEDFTGLPWDSDLEYAIQKGADVMMAEVKAQAEAIPVHPEKAYGMPGEPITGISQRQKTGIIKALGVAPIRRDKDFVNVKIGVDGYNSVKTKKYKKGQPNAMIVRTLESGTSFRARHPFITKAVRAKRRETEQAMAAAYDEAVRRRLGGIING
jgi:hypothetical protein